MNIEKYLSPTEQKNSKIINGDELSLVRVLNMIVAIKDINRDEKNKKIVRIVAINGNIIKLQSYDNGTPYIIVFESEYFDAEGFVENYLKPLCESEQLILTDLTL